MGIGAWAEGADGAKLYLQYGTVQVRDYCETQGYMKTFGAIGTEMLGPACGQCRSGVTEQADQVTISAINRNFPGRGSSGQTSLARPPTVVASAIAGRICSFEQLQKVCWEGRGRSEAYHQEHPNMVRL